MDRRKTIEEDGKTLYHCSRCKTFKTENEFEHRYDNPNKLRSWCKECRKFESAYYHRTARRRMSPNEALIDIERQKRWLADPEITLKKYLLRLTKTSAKNRKLENTLVLEDLILPKECPILKKPFIIGDRWYGYSIDRLDNTKGYTKDNIKIISSLANTMKNSASFEELKSFSENILNYIKILSELQHNLIKKLLINKLIKKYGPNKEPVENLVYMHILKAREGEQKILRFENNLKYNSIEEINFFNVKN